MAPIAKSIRNKAKDRHTRDPYGFIQSDLFVRAKDMIAENEQGAGDVDIIKIAIGVLRHAAEEKGCVPSMLYYAKLMVSVQKKLHLASPWFLEAAIRGHYYSACQLVYTCLWRMKPHRTFAVTQYWMKFFDEWNEYGEMEPPVKEQLKQDNNILKSVCIWCENAESATLTLQTCTLCKVYSYCSKDCQKLDWNKRHRGECRQVQILQKYHKPYAAEIRDAIFRGDDDIPRLQELRKQLGLTRPTEDYENFLQQDSDPFIQPESEKDSTGLFLRPKKDGTVQIGSTPKNI